jgi:hypothetical protein
MSEEQQAVLDENQENVTTEAQDTENQEAAAQETQVDSATTEDAKPVNNAEKRIHKLTAEKYGEKRAREAAEEENRKLKEQLSGSNTQEQPQGKPTLEQFDFDDGQYQSALIAYEVDQRLKVSKEAAQKEQASLKQQEIDASYDANEVKYATENPDYINDVQNLPRFNNDTLSMIKAQENAPQLVHYLGKNLDTAQQIASLDPTSAGVQIGIVLAKLSATNKQTVQTSTAPDPVEPINAGGTLSSDERGPSGATYE